MSAPVSDTDDKVENPKESKIHDVTFEKIEPIWLMIIILGLHHIAAIYGLYLVFTSAKIATTLFALFLFEINIVGITAGVHRLWSHRAYKANFPLRLLLIIMFTCAYQHSVIKWARNHRIHHKYVDTHADPYNSRRGFFFAQIGWTLVKPRPEVVTMGKQIDISDLYADPLVRYQHKYIGAVSFLLCYVIPITIPMYFWNETLANAFFVVVSLRWVVALNVTGLVNSVAHMWGMKPYDKSMSAAQTLTTSFITAGEGWHNYHHAFPWDYKASELGPVWTNITTHFLNFFAKIGWATDLKSVAPELVRRRVERTGDGSHAMWGWTDKDMTQEERLATTILSHGENEPLVTRGI